MDTALPGHLSKGVWIFLFCGASSFSNFFPINSGAMIIKIVLARLLRSSFSEETVNRVGATTNEENMHQTTSSHPQLDFS